MFVVTSCIIDFLFALKCRQSCSQVFSTVQFLITCNGGRRPGPFYHTGLKDANQAFPLSSVYGGRRPGPFYHTGLKDANQAFPLSSVYGGRRPGPFYHAGLKDAKTRREKAWSILSHVMSMLT